MFCFELTHLESVSNDLIVLSNYLEYSRHIRTIRFWNENFYKKKEDQSGRRRQVHWTEYSVRTRNIP